MAKPFERIYTLEQEDAIEYAALDRSVRPMRRICELAQAGELTNQAGEKLPPFTVPLGQVRAVKLKATKRRVGLAKTKLTTLPVPDATAELQRRLIAMADAGTEEMARRQAKARGHVTDWNELREMARAIREIKAIPTPKATSQTTPPGARDHNGDRADSKTRGGRVGTLMAAHQGTRHNDGHGSRTSDGDAPLAA